MFGQAIPEQDVKTPRPQRKFLLGQGGAVFWRKLYAVRALAFKANIDDLRESPSLEIAKQLAERRLADQLLIVEPYVEALPQEFESRRREPDSFVNRVLAQPVLALIGNVDGFE